jgi:hypothetical protein
LKAAMKNFLGKSIFDFGEIEKTPIFATPTEKRIGSSVG